MSMWTLFFIALGLSMDAFAVSVCKGLAAPSVNWKCPVLAGLYFGGFQAAMPFLGYRLGVQFEAQIQRLDHWIAFLLLGVIGINMIRESREEGEKADPSFCAKEMLPLAVATSIDALAVGVTFAFLRVDILPAVLFIGCVTFCLSAAGIRIGNVFGARFKSRAELAGGLILIGMGVKILAEHLG